MTPPRAVRIHTTTGILAAITLLVQCTTATAAGWSLDKVYGERMAMRVADQRCQLFAGSISSALFMGEVQARNTALRSGMDADRLAEIADIAVQRGSTVACRDPALLTEAAHVRSAFSSYSRIQRMDFPGAAAGWKADRTVLSTRVEDGRWALTTTPVRAGSNQRFGIVVQAGRLSLFGEPAPGPGPEPGQMQPSAARLVMRDAQRTARPYLAGNLAPPPRAGQQRKTDVAEQRNEDQGKKRMDARCSQRRPQGHRGRQGSAGKAHEREIDRLRTQRFFGMRRRTVHGPSLAVAAHAPRGA